MSRAQVILYIATSLDGYIATEEGGVEWLDPFNSQGTDYGYAEFYASVDALIMGRRTYEHIRRMGDWPYAGKLTYVLSHHLTPDDSTDVVVSDAAPAECVAELTQRGATRLWLVGGGALVTDFYRRDLIDEYIVFSVPLILGGGIRLFSRCFVRQRLQLARVAQYPSGIVELRYHRSA